MERWKTLLACTQNQTIHRGRVPAAQLFNVAANTVESVPLAVVEKVVPSSQPYAWRVVEILWAGSGMWGVLWKIIGQLYDYSRGG
jgi:hypothetical protein